MLGGDVVVGVVQGDEVRLRPDPARRDVWLAPEYRPAVEQQRTAPGQHEAAEGRPRRLERLLRRHGAAAHPADDGAGRRQGDPRGTGGRGAVLGAADAGRVTQPPGASGPAPSPAGVARVGGQPARGEGVVEGVASPVPRTRRVPRSRSS